MFIKQIYEHTMRIYENGSSMLSRYGILHDGDAKAEHFEGNVLSFQAGRRQLDISFHTEGEGFQICISLSKEERIYGGGDATRDTVMHRGQRLEMNICNVVAYAPIPYLMSTDGWAILVNCTYQHFLDIGKGERDMLVITAPKGSLDFYLFSGNSMSQLLERYTAVSGRPVLFPKFAYGFTFVENDQADTRGMLGDCRSFRERDIPCDMIGLEPGWMEKNYDYSTEKEWSHERFYLPYWLPANQSGKMSFFYNMREMGMQLSLWLCENYDLLQEEEKIVIREEGISMEGADILDKNLMQGEWSDKITKRGEPWFEHLKKFVDNGAAAFKLDGDTQVRMHPDRIWAGKYLDDEVHNVYPIILAKQMYRGFKEYTGRRSYIYSAGGYAGVQQYVGTWAGDTGGGPRTLVSVINHALSGHANTSCDLQVTSAETIHYGFLLPYTQQNGWSNWLYPWFLAQDKEELVRTYSKLRSSLFPYIYAMAHEAAKSGMPIVRPLQLMYETDERFDNVKNMYMLGDSLLVGAFDMHLTLPEGNWVDYFTGREYAGGGEIDYEIPEGWGGALLVRKGSVFVTMVPQKYILEKEHDYIVNVYSGADARFTLVEDDGWTYDYEEDKVARTAITMCETTENGFRLEIAKRQGTFSGRPDNGHDHIQNSIPKIEGIRAVRDMTVRIFGRIPSSITVNGEKQVFQVEEGAVSFVLPAKMHEEKSVQYKVVY